MNYYEKYFEIRWKKLLEKNIKKIDNVIKHIDMELSFYNDLFNRIGEVWKFRVDNKIEPYMDNSELYFEIREKIGNLTYKKSKYEKFLSKAKSKLTSLPEEEYLGTILEDIKIYKNINDKNVLKTKSELNNEYFKNVSQLKDMLEAKKISDEKYKATQERLFFGYATYINNAPAKHDSLIQEKTQDDFVEENKQFEEVEQILDEKYKINWDETLNNIVETLPNKISTIYSQLELYKEKSMNANNMMKKYLDSKDDEQATKYAEIFVATSEKIKNLVAIGDNYEHLMGLSKKDDYLVDIGCVIDGQPISAYKDFRDKSALKTKEELENEYFEKLDSLKEMVKDNKISKERGELLQERLFFDYATFIKKVSIKEDKIDNQIYNEDKVVEFKNSNTQYEENSNNEVIDEVIEQEVPQVQETIDEVIEREVPQVQENIEEVIQREIPQVQENIEEVIQQEVPQVQEPVIDLKENMVNFESKENKNMQKIEFGYSNDKNPTGSHEGIGFKKGLMLTDADYYGAIKLEGEQFVVVKVTEDKYNRYPELLGNFMVIPAIPNMYKDGSGFIYLNQEQSAMAKQIENSINNSEFKDRFSSADDILKAFGGLHKADRTFDMLTDEKYYGNKIVTTAITPEAFEMKNEALKQCNGSFSDLSAQINEMNNYRTY